MFVGVLELIKVEFLTYVCGVFKINRYIYTPNQEIERAIQTQDLGQQNPHPFGWLRDHASNCKFATPPNL